MHIYIIILYIELHVNLYFLLSKSSLLDRLHFGLSLAVSGDTPISPLVFLALLAGHLTLSRAILEHLASSLNSLRSSSAFSRAIIFVLHLLQICVGISSSMQAVSCSKISILLAHCCCKPVAVNKLIALMLLTKPLAC